MLTKTSHQLTTLKADLAKTIQKLNSEKQPLTSLNKNIRSVEQDLRSAIHLKKNYVSRPYAVASDIKNFEGTVRLKEVKKGQWEFRGESHSKLKCFGNLHVGRHKKEVEAARAVINPVFSDASLQEPKAIDSSKLNEYIQLRENTISALNSSVNDSKVELDKKKRLINEINNQVSKLERKQKATQDKIKSTRDGLVAIYSTNHGAKGINNRVRHDYGCVLKTEPSASIRQGASIEWNRAHKDSPFIMSSKEDLDNAVKALHHGAKEAVEFMFDGQKKDTFGIQYRGSMFKPQEGVGALKQGDRFQIGFIMSCDTNEKMANKYASRKYHSDSDTANRGQQPAVYIIEGTPFNIGAGDTGENERNYKPGSQFVVRSVVKRGETTYFKLKEARPIPVKDVNHTVYR
ncbi:hypothetical protein AB4169_07685 [Vibrio lentus]|uniref:Uncharacterized protein n=1 Tax=Vibrio lentus TaxID=136468 RepID=A0A2N7IGW8_9VIBR|nr:hypothetical protein [Vibrio lentus]PML56747.1 hypothetical protein BCT74_03685 [Vibrio lentus]PMM38954.1 hypothetical protein BCT58_23395 [Vibrio lentus]